MMYDTLCRRRNGGRGELLQARTTGSLDGSVWTEIPAGDRAPVLIPPLALYFLVQGWNVYVVTW